MSTLSDLGHKESTRSRKALDMYLKAHCKSLFILENFDRVEKFSDLKQNERTCTGSFDLSASIEATFARKKVTLLLLMLLLLLLMIFHFQTVNC